MIDNLPEKAILIVVMLGVAFPFHEFSHALAAYRLGDSTARLFGRLTLNPVTHFDPIGGSLMAITILLGGGFGYAKPTPVNPRNLRYGRWGEAIVAAAGPLSNLVLAIAGSIPLRFMVSAGIAPSMPAVAYTLLVFVYINLLLLVFNFIPIPPLDGGAVLFAFLPPQTAWQLRPILAQYGIFILLILIFPIVGGTSILGVLVDTIVQPLLHLLTGL